jgi:hypothetical protein
MDEAIKAVIQKYEAQLAPILEQLAPLQDQANRIKDRINGLYELEGENGPYPEATSIKSDYVPRGIPRGTLLSRKDQFFGKPLATVVKEILEWRAKENLGAIPLDDLYELMNQGSYGFEGKDDSTKKRILASSLGKNPAFIRLPNSGDIGLAEWYPSAKRGRPKSSSQIVAELLNGAEVRQDANDFLNTQQFPLNQGESLPKSNEKPQDS